MANNYYDATGVLVLDQVTPVSMAKASAAARISSGLFIRENKRKR
jgi:hypothetical protein